MYVVPEDGSKEFSAVISGTCGFTSVTVHTEELSATPLAMGEVTCIAQTSQSLTFSWDAVDGALGYKVSTDGGESYGEPQTSTTYNWTGLEPEKEYTLYVKAIGNAITISDSDPVSASGTTAEEGAAESVWALVKDASTLAAGDQIVIVASASDKALGTTQNDNNRAAIGVTKSDDTVVIGNTVQIITLETGAVGGTYAFSTGSAGYLYAASSSANHLKTKTALDENGSWSITINASGVATIKANGTKTRNLLKYNSSSTLFSCYASGQDDVSIYRLGSGESGGEEPDPTPEPEPEPTGNTFGKYSGTLTEGDYIIAYSGKAMKATISNNRFGYETVESVEIIEDPDPSIVWHVEKNGDYWTIYNAAEGKYAAGTGVKNKGALVESGTDDESLWTVSGSATYEFVNKKNEFNGVNANLRNNGTYGFACYSTSTGGALTLYKKN